jgi:hypothetical protein
VIKNIKISFYNIIFLYIIFAFQFNLYDYFYPLKISFVFLTLLIVLIEMKYLRFFILFTIISLVLLLFDIKYIASLTFLVFGFLYANTYALKKNFLFDFLILVNVIIMLLQLSGEFEILSKFQDYYVSENLSIFEGQDWFPLFQIRPSGIFPNTIYLSFFLLLAFSYVLNLKVINKNNSIYFFLALSLIISGSTLGLLLSLIIILFNFNVFFLFYFVLIMLFYYLILPDYFFSYNFNLDELILSIQSRLYPNLDGSFNSLVSKDLIIFGIMIILVLGFLLYKKLYKNILLIINILILIFPLILHDFGFNIAYAFFCGYLFSLIYINLISSDVNLNNYFIKK